MSHFKMENSNTNTDKEHADLYFKLYSDCVKYRKERGKTFWFMERRPIRR